MSVKLVHSDASIDIKQRVIRMQMDAVRLSETNPAEVRDLYSYIERVRDVLSRILDRADGKNA